MSVVYGSADLNDFTAVERQAIGDAVTSELLYLLGAQADAIESVSVFSGSIIVDVCFVLTAVNTSDLTAIQDSVNPINVTANGEDRVLSQTATVVLTTCSSSPTSAPTVAPTVPACLGPDPHLCEKLNVSVDCADNSIHALCPLFCGACNALFTTSTDTTVAFTSTVATTSNSAGGSSSTTSSDSPWWAGYALTAVVLLVVLTLLFFASRHRGTNGQSPTEVDQSDLPPGMGRAYLDGEIPVPTTRPDDMNWDHLELEHAMFRAEQRVATMTSDLDTTLEQTIQEQELEPKGFYDKAPDVSQVSRRLTGLADSPGAAFGAPVSPGSPTRQASNVDSMLLRYVSSHADESDLLADEIATQLGSVEGLTAIPSSPGVARANPDMTTRPPRRKKLFRKSSVPGSSIV